MSPKLAGEMAARYDASMLSVIKQAALWGLVIGLANLVWLYVAFFLGLHTSGIWIFQLFMLLWLALTIAGFLLALRSIKGQHPAVGYWSGLGAGTVAAIASAIMATIAQVGYFTVVNPAWPETMAVQTREYMAQQPNATPQSIDQAVAQSREYFSLSNYAVTSAITALVLGIILSAIIMLFLRRKVQLISAAKSAAADMSSSGV
jgi:hypothetical protein